MKRRRRQLLQESRVYYMRNHKCNPHDSHCHHMYHYRRYREENHISEGTVVTLKPVSD